MMNDDSWHGTMGGQRRETLPRKQGGLSQIRETSSGTSLVGSPLSSEHRACYRVFSGSDKETAALSYPVKNGVSQTAYQRGITVIEKNRAFGAVCSEQSVQETRIPSS